MSDRPKRIAVGMVAILVIALVPVIALAASLSNGQAGRPPAASHGPKKTPRPSTVAPTILPTLIPTQPPTTPPSTPPTALPTSPPTLPPITAPPAILVGAGDIASCASTGDEATASLLNTIGGTAFTLGDNVYDNGTAAEFTNCYGPSWGQVGIKPRTRPTTGNHDYNTAGATGYFGYFGAAAGDSTKGYYAYDVGTWRIYVLNSNCAIVACGTGSVQELWLRADLANNPHACVAAMWHHPRFSSGSTHGSSTTVQALYQALYDFNAELILNGHEHNYERFAPQTATGVADNARGIVELVVGTGGRSHYGFGSPIGNSLVRDGVTSGVLRLALSAGSWSSLFIPVAGQTFSDSGTGTCH